MRAPPADGRRAFPSRPRRSAGVWGHADRAGATSTCSRPPRSPARPRPPAARAPSPPPAPPTRACRPTAVVRSGRRSPLLYPSPPHRPPFHRRRGRQPYPPHLQPEPQRHRIPVPVRRPQRVRAPRRRLERRAPNHPVRRPRVRRRHVAQPRRPAPRYRRRPHPHLRRHFHPSVSAPRRPVPHRPRPHHPPGARRRRPSRSAHCGRRCNSGGCRGRRSWCRASSSCR